MSVDRCRLDLRHVSVAADDGGPDARYLVDDVSLCHAAGTWTVLTGPPDAGATVLLRVAAGLLAPVGGEVHASPRLAHVGLAPRPRPSTTLADALVAAAGEDGERSAGLLARLGLTELGDRPLDQLDARAWSLAELALALVGQPELVLAADPTASLEPTAAGVVRELLRELVDRTGLCVVTAEDSVAALAAADRVVLMAKGRVVEVREMPSAGDRIVR